MTDKTPTPQFPFETEFLFSYSATVRSPQEVIGPVADGIRVNFYLTGGEVTGPKVVGKVLPVGSDNFILRRDGIGVLDVRATIETHDGALLYLTYRGLTDLGVNGYDAFLRGEMPPTLSLRAAPRVETAHPGYQWLERRFCVSLGQADLAASVVHYDVHAIR